MNDMNCCIESFEQRVYYVLNGEEITLCYFWLNEDGEVGDNIRIPPEELAELFKQMKFREVHVEATGIIEVG